MEESKWVQIVIMIPYALWQRSRTVETVEITSSKMLEELLDQLTVQANKDDMPFTVQIILDDTSGILLTVWSELSHLESYSELHRPPVVISLGDWGDNQDELITALHGGIPSTINKKSCVPSEKAREAVRQYFKTGKRPVNISWTE